jgi:hypothetical protein
MEKITLPTSPKVTFQRCDAQFAPSAFHSILCLQCQSYSRPSQSQRQFLVGHVRESA